METYAILNISSRVLCITIFKGENSRIVLSLEGLLQNIVKQKRVVSHIAKYIHIHLANVMLFFIGRGIFIFLIIVMFGVICSIYIFAI